MSRPNKEVTRDKVLRIKMTDEEMESLRREAMAKETSMSELVRRALEDQLYQSIWCTRRK